MMPRFTSISTGYAIVALVVVGTITSAPAATANHGTNASERSKSAHLPVIELELKEQAVVSGSVIRLSDLVHDGHGLAVFHQSLLENCLFPAPLVATHPSAQELREHPKIQINSELLESADGSRQIIINLPR